MSTADPHEARPLRKSDAPADLDTCSTVQYERARLERMLIDPSDVCKRPATTAPGHVQSTMAVPFGLRVRSKTREDDELWWELISSTRNAQPDRADENLGRHGCVPASSIGARGSKNA